MEVSFKKSVDTRNRSQCNSFDCDPATLDAVLGLKPCVKTKTRIDQSEKTLHSHLERRPAQVYAPLDVVPAVSSQCERRSTSTGTELAIDTEFKRERLVRLLDRQQACYDAQQQAARAAENLLSLCEHHQQQWLIPNRPT